MVIASSVFSSIKEVFEKRSVVVDKRQTRRLTKRNNFGLKQFSRISPVAFAEWELFPQLGEYYASINLLNPFSLALLYS